jgi:hypothetical protein
LCRRVSDADRRRASAFKRRETFLKRCPFSIQRSKPGLNTGNFVFFRIAHEFGG